MLLWLTCGDEVSILELHGFGTLGAQLSRDNDLATLGAILHDEANDTIAGSADSQTSQQLVSQGLALGHCASSAILDTLGEELDAVLWEAISLLNHCGELTNAASLLAKHLSSTSGADDDLGSDRSDSHFDASVAILGQGAHQELVELCVEDAISDELALLADLCLVGHDAISRTRKV